MRSGRVGFLFKNMGQVGVQGGVAYTHDNEFHCPFSVSALRAENSQFANFSIFHVQNNTTLYDPSLCGANNGTSSANAPLGTNGFPWWPWVQTQLSAGNSTIPCSPFYFLRTAETDSSSEYEDREVFDPVYGPEILDEQVIAFLHKIAMDSLEYESNAEYLRFISRYQLYSIIKDRDSLRIQDSIFSMFYTVADSGSIGKIDRVIHALGNREPEDAEDELNNWSTSGDVEETWKSWFYIVLDPEAEISNILDIANHCPEDFGYPVHAARSKLLALGLDSLIEIQDCEQWLYAEDMDEEDSPGEGTPEYILSIYPNPASIEVTFEHELESTENVRIIVYDNMGNLKYNELFAENSRNLSWDTSLEISGLYYVILMQDDIVLESKTLAIIH
jgi:hypothetical protein